MLEVGKPAPAFKLAGSDGQVHSLKGYAGKKVVLYFYPKDDTPGCTREACDLRDSWSEIKELNAVVLGVSADDDKSHRKFSAKYNLPFTLLSDPWHEAMEAYGVWGEKVNYGRKYMGIIRTTVLIDEKGKVIKFWPKVKVEGHRDEILAALRGE
ncbi:MAG TPA: thioredoxin-dependent thiol peroxidase [Thermoplasmata archaeon]|nr:thioredoxin-dependent thiol peroxidase [Thermoplasmata archaeon]